MQGSNDTVLRLRWLHALRMKDMREASKLIETSRELHSIGRNLEEACCLDSISKLALIAAQRPGSEALSAEVIIALQVKSYSRNPIASNAHLIQKVT